MTMSAPASALGEVENLTSSALSAIRPPSLSVRVRPLPAICSPTLSRPIRVTSSPHAAQAPPIQQPIDPAPRTTMRGFSFRAYPRPR